jgi:membrane-associated phospholipid phosphatase
VNVWCPLGRPDGDTVSMQQFLVDSGSVDDVPTRERTSLWSAPGTVHRAVAWLVAGDIVLGLLGLIVGLSIVGRHGGGPIQGWDDTVGRWFLHHRAHLVTPAKVIAFGGDAPVLAVISIALTLGLVVARQRVRAFIPLVAYLGGEFLVYAIREFIHRSRPPTANFPALHAIPGVHETTYSFPSGHATATTAVLFGLAGLAAVTWRAWWPWLAASLVTVAVAGSRLVLGVHWSSDVIVGLILGACWGILVSWALREAPWPVRLLGRHRPDVARPRAPDEKRSSAAARAGAGAPVVLGDELQRL